MKKLIVIYSGKGLQEPLSNLIRAYPFEQVSIIDDTIISECIQAHKVTPNVEQRLGKYYRGAVEMGGDIILNTCSSVGDVADEWKEKIDIPLIRIDEAMAEKVVRNHSKIAVVATLNTTLDPTLRLIKSKARAMGKEIEVIDVLAEGAFEALVGGDARKHDEIIEETVKKISNADCLCLAQASMMRMEETLQKAVAIPVYSSPRLCMEDLSQKFAKERLL